MTLNNSKSIVNLKLRARTAIILFITYLILAYAARVIKFPLLGINSVAWTIFFSACFLFIIFFPVVLKYQYVFYSDEGNEIIFRYFSAGVVEGNKNSVEINKKTFTGFTLEKEVFRTDTEHYFISAAKKRGGKISSDLYKCAHSQG